MKNSILTLLVFIACSTCQLFAQGWVELGTGINALNANNSIYAMCLDTGGVIYVSGGFTDSVVTSGGKAYVAKWNGASWSALGTGVNAFPSLGGINILCVDAAHNLYAGNGYDPVTEKFFIAKWNGVSWDELGTGANSLKANDFINALCADNMGNIYAAGTFTDSVSNTAGHPYVAKWDGSTWTELGTGSNALNADDDIRSITADADGNIYAAGSFRYFPGGYYYVAKWDGSSWAQLGSGSDALNANAPIWSICADRSNNIYAGGMFLDPDGVAYVAKWNGTTWAEVGAGSAALINNEFIYSVCADASDNIYFAGGFSHEGYKILRWNGTTWSEAGGTNSLHANGTIFNVCTGGNSVYASGAFTDSIDNEKGHSYVAKLGNSDLTVYNKNSHKGTFEIIPNPSTDLIRIDGFNDFNGCFYLICSMSGDLIKQGKITQSCFISIVDLPKGVYVLKIADLSMKFVKI